MRYFLLDKITAVVPGERAEGVKNVTLTDEVLHDHFPDFPVLPGVLVVEAAAQLAGFLLEVSLNPPREPAAPPENPKRAVLIQIREAKLYKPAGPGDQIELSATLGSALETAAQVSIAAKVKGERVMRGGLTFMMKTIDSERVHEQRRSLYRCWTRTLELPFEIR